jgi:hypothetical protein
MPVDPNKKYYPAAAGDTASGIVNRILHLTATDVIPNFGQIGIGAKALEAVMGESMMQEFVDDIGEMYYQRHDYESDVAWVKLHHYRYAKLAEQLVGEVHERGGPG